MFPFDYLFPTIINICLLYFFYFILLQYQ